MPCRGGWLLAGWCSLWVMGSATDLLGSVCLFGGAACIALPSGCQGCILRHLMGGHRTVHTHVFKAGFREKARIHCREPHDRDLA